VWKKLSIRGIVIAVCLAAHRGLEAGGLDHLAIILRGILNTPIGMVDQAAARLFRRDGHPQRCQRQFGTQMIGHCPADNPAAVQVHDGGQIEPALIGLDVMSASQTQFGAGATKFRSSRFEAIGNSWRLSVVRTHRGRAMMALMP
jgi:hypothetical protein